MEDKKVTAWVQGNGRYLLKAEVVVTLDGKGGVFSSKFSKPYCLVEGLERPFSALDEDERFDLLAEAEYVVTNGGWD